MEFPTESKIMRKVKEIVLQNGKLTACRAIQDIFKLKFNCRARNENLQPAKQSRKSLSSNSITELEMKTYILQSSPGNL